VPRIGSTPSPLPLERSSASYGPWRLDPGGSRPPAIAVLVFESSQRRAAWIRECSTRRFRASVIAPFGASAPWGAGGHQCASPISRFRAPRGLALPAFVPESSPRSHASYLLVSRLRVRAASGPKVRKPPTEARTQQRVRAVVAFSRQGRERSGSMPDESVPRPQGAASRGDPVRQPSIRRFSRRRSLASGHRATVAGNPRTHPPYMMVSRMGRLPAGPAEVGIEVRRSRPRPFPGRAGGAVRKPPIRRFRGRLCTPSPQGGPGA
jgi:hypothetical protein